MRCGCDGDDDDGEHLFINIFMLFCCPTYFISFVVFLGYQNLIFTYKIIQNCMYESRMDRNLTTCESSNIQEILKTETHLPSIAARKHLRYYIFLQKSFV